MKELGNLQIELHEYNGNIFYPEYDLDRLIYDIDSQIDLLSSQADMYDYLVSIGSGVLCGLLDTLWVKSFSLERGRGIASNSL